MTDQGKNVEAIVISGAWPMENNGYGIAVNASLRQYCKFFLKVHFLGLFYENFAEMDRWRGLDIDWAAILLKRRPLWLKFAKSIMRPSPAITMRYAPFSRTVRSRVGCWIEAARCSGRKVVIVYEDVAIAYFLSILRSEWPEVPQAIRSHNVTVKAFEGLIREGNLAERWSWKIEIAKIRRFEKAVCESADRFWAITQNDADKYAELLAVRPHGVLGISMDTDRYRDIEPGDACTVVHMGAADLRKGKGLMKFISRAWPIIRAQVPGARLVIGGRGTERLTNTKLAVEGLGFIRNDREVLKKGMIFINPQQIGSGIKLKSVVAMLAAKALVSTPTGIEGVEGTDGQHFLVAKEWGAVATNIVQLMKDPQTAMRVGSDARKLASALYNRRHLERTVQPLLEEFVSGRKG